jgi:hypothetical protein
MTYEPTAAPGLTAKLPLTLPNELIVQVGTGLVAIIVDAGLVEIVHVRELPVLKPPPNTVMPPSRVPKPTGTICPAAPVGSMKIVGPLTLLKFAVPGPGAPGAV